MTLNELVSAVADQLNLASAEARARIARNINIRYKRVTSSIGLIPTRREEVSKAATIGNRQMTFTGIEKLDVVYRIVSNKKHLLDPVTDDEMLEESLVDEPATKYSVFSVAPQAVTIELNCIPTTTFTLYARGLADASNLSNTDSPQIPESFHDIFLYGAYADEYRKREDHESMQLAERDFENRVSDLRLFLAKNAYIDNYSGKLAKSRGWWDIGTKG